MQVCARCKQHKCICDGGPMGSEFRGAINSGLAAKLLLFNFPPEVLTVIQREIKDTNGEFSARALAINRVIAAYGVRLCVHVSAWDSTWRFSCDSSYIDVTLADFTPREIDLKKDIFTFLRNNGHQYSVRYGIVTVSTSDGKKWGFTTPEPAKR